LWQLTKLNYLWVDIKMFIQFPACILYWLFHFQSARRLDRNNLSGQIPVDVANLAGLTFLYVSFQLVCFSFLHLCASVEQLALNWQINISQWLIIQQFKWPSSKNLCTWLQVSWEYMAICTLSFCFLTQMYF
jgi:hypothetical protein